MDVELPDGTLVEGVPDGISQGDLVSLLAKNGHDTSWYNAPTPGIIDRIKGALPTSEERAPMPSTADTINEPWTSPKDRSTELPGSVMNGYTPVAGDQGLPPEAGMGPMRRDFYEGVRAGLISRPVQEHAAIAQVDGQVGKIARESLPSRIESVERNLAGDTVPRSQRELMDNTTAGLAAQPLRSEAAKEANRQWLTENSEAAIEGIKRFTKMDQSDAEAELNQMIKYGIKPAWVDGSIPDATLAQAAAVNLKATGPALHKALLGLSEAAADQPFLQLPWVDYAKRTPRELEAMVSDLDKQIRSARNVGGKIEAGSWNDVVASMGPSLSVNLPPLIAASLVAARNPAAGMAVANGGLGVMGLQSFGDAYLKGQMKGLSASDNLTQASLTFAAEVIPEKLSLNALFSVFKTMGKGAAVETIKAFAKQQLTEHSTEQITTITEHLIDKAYTEPNKSLESLWSEMKQTAMATAIQAPILSGGGLIAHGIGRAATSRKQDLTEGVEFDQGQIDAAARQSLDPENAQMRMAVNRAPRAQPADILTAPDVDTAIAAASDSISAAEEEFADLLKSEQSDLAYLRRDAAAESAKAADFERAAQQQADLQIDQANALTKAQGFDEQQPTAMQLAMARARQKASAAPAQTPVSATPIEAQPEPAAAVPPASAPVAQAEPEAATPSNDAGPATQTIDSYLTQNAAGRWQLSRPVELSIKDQVIAEMDRRNQEGAANAVETAQTVAQPAQQPEVPAAAAIAQGEQNANQLGIPISATAEAARSSVEATDVAAGGQGVQGQAPAAQVAQPNPEANRPNPVAEKLPGTQSVAQRQVNAVEKFVDSVVEQFGLTKEEAGRAWDYLHTNKLVKVDAVGGQYNLKDGRLWDVDAMRKAAGIVAAAPTQDKAAPAVTRTKAGKLEISGFTRDDVTESLNAAKIKATVAVGKDGRVLVSAVGRSGNPAPLTIKQGKAIETALMGKTARAKKPRQYTGNLRNDVNLIAPGLYAEVARGGDGESMDLDMSLVAEKLRGEGFMLPTTETGKDSDAVIELIRQDIANGGGTLNEARKIKAMTEAEQKAHRADVLRLADEYGIQTKKGVILRALADIEAELKTAIEQEIGVAGKSMATAYDAAIAAGIPQAEADAILDNIDNFYQSETSPDRWVMQYREQANALQEAIDAHQEREGRDQEGEGAGDNLSPGAGSEGRPGFELAGQTEAELRAEQERVDAAKAAEEAAAREAEARARKEQAAKDKADIQNRLANQPFEFGVGAKEAKTVQRDLLSQPAESKTIAEASLGDLLRAAADKADGKPIATNPSAPVSSVDGQKNLANRGSRIATLKMMNEQIRKLDPAEAWHDSNIEDAQDLDSLQDQISQTLVDLQRTKAASEGKPVATKEPATQGEAPPASLPSEAAKEGEASTNSLLISGDVATEDAGEELKYNKRNRVVRLKWDDIKDQDAALKVKQVVKAKVLEKPDYQAMIDGGTQPLIAHIVKQVYDGLAAKPQTRVAPTDEQLQIYIDGMNRVMDGAMAWANSQDSIEWLKKMGESASVQRAAMTGSRVDLSAMAGKKTEFKRLLDYIYPEGWKEYRPELVIVGGNRAISAMQPGLDETIKALKEIEKGWPGTRESWQIQGYTIRQVEPQSIDTRYYEDKRTDGTPYVSVRMTVTDGRQSFVLYSDAIHGAETKADAAVQNVVKEVTDAVTGKQVLFDKRGRMVGAYETQDAAQDAAREKVKRTGGGGIKEEGISVQAARRVGKERREGGENVTSAKLMETFGFRGVNFGNWMKGKSNEAERQLHLNHAYDAFLDLAEVLDVPPKAMSLNGMLGLAIGAQGNGTAAAHFVPGLNEINITRTAGAGAVAHEWGHALDHYFARKAGLEREAEPFLTEHANSPATMHRIEIVDGARKSVSVPRFGDGLRTEILDRFREIVTAMNKRELTAEEVAQRKKNNLESAKKNVERWLESIRRDYLAPSLQGKIQGAEFDAIADRIRKMDLGSGEKVKLSKWNYISPVVAELRALYKTKTGYSYSADNIKALQSWVDSVEYGTSSQQEDADHKPQTTPTTYASNAAKLDRDKGGKKYWSTDLEKFARAFDAFVSDQLEERAAKNSYLAGLNNDIETSPMGDERKATNAAFKALVDTIETKETDKGVALESRDTANIETATRRMGKFVDAFTAGQMRGTDEQLLGPTPHVLQMLGAEPLQMHIDAGTIKKVLGGKHQHHITADMLKQLPQALYDPLAVFNSPSGNGEPGKFVLTEIVSRTGTPVVVAVHLSKASLRVRVNDIASVYEWSNATSRLQKLAPDLEYIRNEQSLKPSTIFSALDWENMVQSARDSGAIILTEDDVVNRYGDQYSKTPAATITGETPDAIRAGLRRSLGKATVDRLEQSGLLRILDTADSLPDGLTISDTGTALYDGKTAYLIADRTKPAEAIKAVLHEIGEHHGLEGMLGEKGYKTLTNRVRIMEKGNARVKEAFDFVRSAYKKYDEKTDPRFMKEVLANIGQDADVRARPWWKEIIAAVRRWLVKLGYGGLVRTSDIEDMVLHSLKMAARENQNEGSRGVVDAKASPMYSFAGPLANTADAYALETAQQRLASGDDSDAVRRETGWFKGADGKWRFEINDSNASLKKESVSKMSVDIFVRKMKTSRSLSLGNVLDHPRLFAAYPFMKNYRVMMDLDQTKGGKFEGDVDGWGRITLNAKGDYLSTLLHEIQHGIQTREGFARGGNMRTFARDLPDGGFDNGYESYRRLAGEVEARNTQARAGMNEDERTATSPESTADVNQSDVIVVFDGKEMANAPAPENAKVGASTPAFKAVDTESAEFKAWHAGSKVRGTVYHSTPYDFDVFEFSDQLGPHFGTEQAAIERGEKTGGNENNVDVTKDEKSGKWEVWIDNDLEGEYESEKDANNVADAARERKPMAVYLSVKNPLSLPDLGVWSFDGVRSYLNLHNIITDKEATRAWNEWQKSDQAGWTALRSILEAKGYDSISYHNDVEDAGSVSYIALRPTQIKSAEKNTGAFSATNPSILESRSAPYLKNALDLAYSLAGPSVKTLGSLNNVVTQLHKARRDPQHFGKVFNLAMAFRTDLSRSAYRSWEMAKDILPAYDDIRTAVKTLAMGRKGQKEIARAATMLFEGTTYGGGNPLAGMRWTHQQLKDKYNATDKEIELYDQARAAIDSSLTEVSNSIAWKLAKPHLSNSLKADIIGNPEAAEDTLLEALEFAKQAADPDGAATIDGAIQSVNALYEQAYRLKAAGYTPLSRFGRYTVDVFEIGNDGKIKRDIKGVPARLEFKKFDFEAEARAEEKRLKQQYADRSDVMIKRGVQGESKLFAGVDPETVALFVEQVSEIPGLDIKREVLDEWRREAVSQRSAITHNIKRKGVAGYSEDLPRVLATFLTSNARYASANFHMADMLKAINDIPDSMGDVKDDAANLYQYINANNEPGAWMRGLMFAWYLGGSPAAAAVNMTQPVLMTFPYLQQFGNASKHLLSSVRQAMQPGLIPTSLRLPLNRAMEEGIVEAQEIHHLYAEGMKPLIARLPGGEGLRARAQSAATLWGAFFGMAENFNRRISFLAAYKMAEEMGAEKLKAKGFPSSYAFARRAVEETQGIYAKENRPNWARGTGTFGAVGVAAFTFKQFSIQYVELLTRMYRAGPEGKMAAGLMLGLLILASGLQGVPGADDLDDLIDTILQSLGYRGNVKKAKRDALKKLAGERMADIVMYGLSAETPIDVQARLGLGNILPATGLFKPSEQNKAGQIAEFFGPPGGMARSVGDFIDATQSGQRGSAFSALSPVFVRNIAKAYQMADTGEYKDTRGRKVENVDLTDAAIKGFGFQPQHIAAASRKAQMVRQDIARVKDVEADIAAVWAQGVSDKKPDEVSRARAMLKDWNEKNKETPIRIDYSQILRRVKEMKKERSNRLEKTAPRELRGYAREGLN